MSDLHGRLITVFLAAILLSCAVSWPVVAAYRRAMLRLMRAPLDAPTPGPPIAAATAPPSVPGDDVHVADNRRHGQRLTAWLCGLSLLISATGAIVWARLAFRGEDVPAMRLAAAVLMQSWPVVPAVGLIWRWSRARIGAAIVLWVAIAFPILLWRSIDPRPLALLAALGAEMGLSIVAIGLMLLSDSTRVVAPWLMLPMAGLIGASIVGLDVLSRLAERESPVLGWFLQWLPNNALGTTAVMAVFALGPWVVAWWPLRHIGRGLAQLYARKWTSELLTVFGLLWAIVLLDRALTTAPSAGLQAAWLLVPLAWIPVGMSVYRRWWPPPTRPPTLLALRVFRRDADVQRLFDEVIERWRLSGNTVMIAGTDLAVRTMEADEMFLLLEGRLRDRFVLTSADVASRIAAFDLRADVDGRYRVNECYCHDTTWQDALRALVDRSDVVLTDLRGFRAENAGCRFELATLAASSRPRRVVVLFDAATDRATAALETSQAPERFCWIDSSRLDAPTRRRVLASLFDGRTTAPAEPGRRPAPAANAV